MSLAVIAAAGLLSLAPSVRAQDTAPTPAPAAPTTPPPARRGGARLSPEERVKMYTEKLKLTAEQQPKVKTLVEENVKAMRDLPAEDRRAKGPAVNEEFAKKMKEVLTADQFKQFEEIQKQMRPGARRNAEGAAPAAPADGAAKKKTAE